MKNREVEHMLKIFLIIGVTAIIISGIYLGAWTDAQHQRANFHSETEEYRNTRTKVAMVSGLVGFLSLGIAMLIYFL